jgi:hypothetical protein
VYFIAAEKREGKDATTPATASQVPSRFLTTLQEPQE